jgi:hypothetical protein
LVSSKLTAKNKFRPARFDGNQAWGESGHFTCGAMPEGFAPYGDGEAIDYGV